MADDRDHALRVLRRYAREYGDRKVALDREVAALRDDRDRAILEAFAAGVSTREIARVLGISHQRVAQIVLQR